MSAVDNVNRLTQKVEKEELLAVVTVYPDEVMVNVHAADNTLTPDQARDLAAAILDGAALAESVEWEDDDDDNNFNVIPKPEPS
jgi:hypothetical protein